MYTINRTIENGKVIKAEIFNEETGETIKVDLKKERIKTETDLDDFFIKKYSLFTKEA